jgi:acetyltransferase-like isoleucine patch superfamily enzyme
MSILRSLADRAVVRFTRDKYESRFLRRYFERHYGIRIGLYSYGFFDRWRVSPGTIIGRYSGLAATARLIDANHPTETLSTSAYFYLPKYDFAQKLRDPQPPQIVEDDVWIGHGAIITPECRIVGRGAIIGAGAIVGRDVPRYAVMIGSPARLVRYRFAPEVIEAIEATQWWLLDNTDLKRGLGVAKDFLSLPSVESAQAFSRAITRSR